MLIIFCLVNLFLLPDNKETLIEKNVLTESVIEKDTTIDIDTLKQLVKSFPYIVNKGDIQKTFGNLIIEKNICRYTTQDDRYMIDISKNVFTGQNSKTLHPIDQLPPVQCTESIPYYILSESEILQGTAAIAGNIFVIPFILFSVYFGKLSDKYAKSRIIKQAKILEFIVMSIGLLTFCLYYLISNDQIDFTIGYQIRKIERHYTLYRNH